MFGLVSQECQNVNLVQEGSQELSDGAAGYVRKVNVLWPPPSWIRAIPRRLTLALAFNGAGLLATIPFLLKATSLTTAVFSSLAMPCFAAGFLIYTVAVIRDLHEHGVL